MLRGLVKNFLKKVVDFLSGILYKVLPPPERAGRKKQLFDIRIGRSEKRIKSIKEFGWRV